MTRARQSGSDWGDGSYERFSRTLAPAAERLVGVAAPRSGERALDLGCGNGNATALLVRAGTEVTAVDPSRRLLGLAEARIAELGGAVMAVHGGAEALPLPDDAFDLVVSSFAVIFCAEQQAAVREVLRVLAPGGRFAYSAWRPEGGISEAGRLLRELLPSSDEAPADEQLPPQGAWDQPEDWLAALVPGGEHALTLHEATVDFEAESGAAWLEEMAAHHPMWRIARRQIADEVRWTDYVERAAAVLDAESIAADRMVIRAPYVIVQVQPPS